jgi:hypothetical protein
VPGFVLFVLLLPVIVLLKISKLCVFIRRSEFDPHHPLASKSIVRGLFEPARKPLTAQNPYSVKAFESSTISVPKSVDGSPQKETRQKNSWVSSGSGSLPSE